MSNVSKKFWGIMGMGLLLLGFVGIVSAQTKLFYQQGGTSTTTAVTQGIFYFNGTTGNFAQDTANLIWNFNTNTMGLGTTSPSQRLSVQGGGLFSGNLSLANLTATGTVNFTGTGATTTISGGLSVGNNAALVVNQAATANSLYITTAGNVGIGTTAPNGKLTIQAPDTLVSPALSIHNSGNNYGWDFDSEFESVGRLDLYAINVGTRSHVMSWMRSSGNVGIGTTGPSGKLSLGTYSYDAATPKTWSTVSEDQMILDFYYLNSAGTYDRYLDIVASGDLTGGAAGNGDSYIRFFTNVAQNGVGERVRIDNSGNVGIGTTSPSAKLSVNAASTGMGFYLAGYANGTGELFKVSTSTASATSTAFVIDSNGKVGIGTTTPYAQLSVAGLTASGYYNADSATATSTFSGGFTAG